MDFTTPRDQPIKRQDDGEKPISSKKRHRHLEVKCEYCGRDCLFRRTTKWLCGCNERNCEKDTKRICRGCYDEAWKGFKERERPGVAAN